MQRRGFTLIELLVVMAIIALLLSILIPSLSRAREVAKRAICASNMRGLMQAIYLYANDNRDQIVSAGLAHGGSGNEHAAWIDSLRSHYGGNTLIARCPSDDSVHWDFPLEPDDTLVSNRSSSGEENDDDPDEETDLPEPVFRRTSYGTNYYTVDQIGDRGPYRKLSMIRRPATTIHMVELAEEGPFAVSDHVHPETWWSNPRQLAAEEVALDRHLGRANYSFFDGHVAPHRFEETYEIDNQRSTFRNIVWKHNYYDPQVAR